VPTPYPREFRDDVVRVARNRDDGVTIEQIATDFGVHPMTLTKWMRQADIDEGTKPRSTDGPGRIGVMAGDLDCGRLAHAVAAGLPSFSCWVFRSGLSADGSGRRGEWRTVADSVAPQRKPMFGPWPVGGQVQDGSALRAG
jgi:hypothetical protein